TPWCSCCCSSSSARTPRSWCCAVTPRRPSTSAPRRCCRCSASPPACCSCGSRRRRSGVSPRCCCWSGSCCTSSPGWPDVGPARPGAFRAADRIGPVATPLVIDTDPGIDDALAILLALASPEVDLRLVTTVHGNVELAQTTENALRVLHLAGRSDVPVAAGARSSLVHPQPERAGHVHGAAGLGGVELPPSPATVDPRPAVVALAELLMTSAEPVTVAAIGPLTNIALLLRVFPDAAARIGRLVVMGGSATRGGNVTAAAEFNVWADPEAAQAVLTAGLPTTMVGLDVTVPTVLTEAGIARFAAAGPVGAQAAAILQQYLDHARSSYGT